MMTALVLLETVTRGTAVRHKKLRLLFGPTGPQQGPGCPRATLLDAQMKMDSRKMSGYKVYLKKIFPIAPINLPRWKKGSNGKCREFDESLDVTRVACLGVQIVLYANGEVGDIFGSGLKILDFRYTMVCTL